MATGPRLTSSTAHFWRQTENSRDFDIILRRPDYLAQFISDLLSHYESSHDPQELSEAQELIEKLKRLKPDTLDQVILQARIYKAQNQVDKAVQLIETNASRPTADGLRASGPGQARRGPGVYSTWPNGSSGN